MKRVVPRTSILVTRTTLPAMRFSDKLKDKERGDERQYFNREDERLLRNLLKKMDHQVDKNAVEEDKGERAHRELKDLFKKYDLKSSDSFLQDLVDWKYE